MLYAPCSLPVLLVYVRHLWIFQCLRLIGPGSSCNFADDSSDGTPGAETMKVSGMKTVTARWVFGGWLYSICRRRGINP